VRYEWQGSARSRRYRIALKYLARLISLALCFTTGTGWTAEPSIIDWGKVRFGMTMEQFKEAYSSGCSMERLNTSFCIAHEPVHLGHHRFSYNGTLFAVFSTRGLCQVSLRIGSTWSQENVPLPGNIASSFQAIVATLLSSLGGPSLVLEETPSEERLRYLAPFEKLLLWRLGDSSVISVELGIEDSKARFLVLSQLGPKVFQDADDLSLEQDHLSE
jgi:hypothetical protein